MFSDQYFEVFEVNQFEFLLLCLCVCAHPCFVFFHYVCLQWTEAGASGASGRRVVQTVRCGGAGSAPSPHLAPGAKTARGSSSSL